jgi:hypothetical protein
MKRYRGKRRMKNERERDPANAHNVLRGLPPSKKERKKKRKERKILL